MERKGGNLTILTVKDLNFLDIWTKVLENIRESISKPLVVSRI